MFGFGAWIGGFMRILQTFDGYFKFYTIFCCKNWKKVLPDTYLGSIFFEKWIWQIVMTLNSVAGWCNDKILNEVAFEFVCNSDFTRKFAEVKKYLVKQKSYLDTNCDFTKHSTSLCRHKIHLIVSTCGRFHFGMKLIMKKHFYFDEF